METLRARRAADQSIPWDTRAARQMTIALGEVNRGLT
jgi:hypothetical protein